MEHICEKIPTYTTINEQSRTYALIHKNTKIHEHSRTLMKHHEISRKSTKNGTKFDAEINGKPINNSMQKNIDFFLITRKSICRNLDFGAPV